MTPKTSTQIVMAVDSIDAKETIFVEQIAPSGWEFAICLVFCAVGLCVSALADTGGRFSTPWAYPLFWVGLFLIYFPIAVRVCMPQVVRQERIVLLLVLGMASYVVKVLEYPIRFTFYDEFLHWRTAQDIMTSHHLFQTNSLLPISPLYPGLENVTTALSSMTGLSIFVSGLLVVGAARIVLMLALYLFFERISTSPRVAGIALLIYATSPHFLFFDSQFGYESLAVPLFALALFALSQILQSGQIDRAGIVLIALLSLAALVVTHHVTSFLLVALLLIWAVAALVVRAPRRERNTIALTAIFGVEVVVFWLLYVGSLVLSYLSPYLLSSAQEAVRLITRSEAVRPLFTDSSGQVAPLWERLVATGSVAIILLLLPFALWNIWRHQRKNATIVMLGVLALAFPATIALRLTAIGAEPSTRLSTFLYIPVTFVVALGIVQFWVTWMPRRVQMYVAAVAAVILFVGGVISGGGPTWARLPGPYLVSADMRSIEPEGIATADWARQYLGPNNRVATDRINQLLMGTYGRQTVVTEINDQIQVSPIFYSTTLDPFDISILQQAKIRYLVVDRRMSSGLPHVGLYYDTGDPQVNGRILIVPAASLAKFDALPLVNHVYDSGDIEIYDMGVLLND